MSRLGFLHFIIGLSCKYNPDIHNYYPDSKQFKNWNEKICKNYSIEQKNRFTIIIKLSNNTMKINSNIYPLDFAKFNINKSFNDLPNEILQIKSTRKKFLTIPTIIIGINCAHSVLIIYRKNLDKFYICDSESVHSHNHQIQTKLNQIYSNIFGHYEILCYSIQNLEHTNKYIGLKYGEFSGGYCMGWTFLLAFLQIKYHWIGIEDLVKKLMWNVEYSPKISRQLIRGFIVFMCEQIN
jgi:hypothetical protein